MSQLTAVQKSEVRNLCSAILFSDDSDSEDKRIDELAALLADVAAGPIVLHLDGAELARDVADTLQRQAGVRVNLR